jgi:hypothetical protein
MCHFWSTLMCIHIHTFQFLYITLSFLLLGNILCILCWNVVFKIQFKWFKRNVATLLWPSVGVKPNTWKKLGLESSETPESSEDDLEDQNTSHWVVLGVIGKVLKRRYRKCPRILDLDICSPTYGQKNGRESNWQFDSRSLKVGNRPAPNVRFGSAIRRWKDLDEGYNFGLDLVAIRGRGEELCSPKVPGVLNRDTWVDFGTPTWESREFVPFGCGCGGASQSIL